MNYYNEGSFAAKAMEDLVKLVAILIQNVLMCDILIA